MVFFISCWLMCVMPCLRRMKSIQCAMPAELSTRVMSKSKPTVKAKEEDSEDEDEAGMICVLFHFSLLERLREVEITWLAFDFFV